MILLGLWFSSNKLCACSCGLQVHESELGLRFSGVGSALVLGHFWRLGDRFGTVSGDTRFTRFLTVEDSRHVFGMVLGVPWEFYLMALFLVRSSLIEWEDHRHVRGVEFHPWVIVWCLNLSCPIMGKMEWWILAFLRCPEAGGDSHDQRLRIWPWKTWHRCTSQLPSWEIQAAPVVWEGLGSSKPTHDHSILE